MDAELQAVKKTLKKWETCFTFAHQRKPDKADIEAAPDNIKEAYKKYAQLKKVSGGEAAKGEVWGKDLNKSTSINTSDTNNQKERKTYLSSVKEKLYARTFSLPRPNQGTSATNKSSEHKFKNAKSATDNESGSNDNRKTEDTAKSTDSNEQCTPVKKGGVFERALSLTAKKSSIAVPKPSTETFASLLTFHQSNAKKTAQKAKYLQSFTSSHDDEASTNFPAKVVDKENDSGKSPEMITGSTKTIVPCSTADTCQNGQLVVKDTDKVHQSEPSFETQHRKSEEAEPKSNKNSNVKSKNREKIDTAKPQTTCKKSGVISFPIPKTRVSHYEKHDFSSFVETDKTFELSKKRKREETEMATDYSFSEEKSNDVIWQSDSGQLPEDLNTPSDTDVSPERKEEPPKKRSKTFARNTSTGGGGNFVRLNLRVKRFSRGRGGFRGGHIKRMQWKEKMKARSESYGNKCFKCGEAGHWANKCKGKAKPGGTSANGGLPNGWSSSVENEEFPTIQEAMDSARGVKRTRPATAKKVMKDEEIKVDNDGEPAAVNAVEDDLDELEVVRMAYTPPPPPPPSKPLYELNPDGSIPDTPQEVYYALNSLGYSGFRHGQEQAVMRILCGQSTLVVLATGSGKSLCYQLPAYIYGKMTRGITLVISPLVSLMEDQVTGLPPGLSGFCLHTNMTKSQREKVISAVTAGKVHFLLMSPEALVGGGSTGMMAGITGMPSIAFACIDEAHCLSEWSHHFRPSYLRVCKVLREKLGVKCMLGLTATATMTTAASVAQHLGISNYEEATIRSTAVPNNLMMTVSRDENKDEALIHLLQGERFSSCCSIIVYCTRRQETERLATLIRTCLKDVTLGVTAEDLDEPPAKGKKKANKSKKKPYNYWDAESYHAGLTAAKRKRVQNAFMNGDLRVVVATVAFGMGLDKSDVRGIIHYNLPRSFESYVQEIGRAGRDGKTSHCHVFLDEEGRDMNELKRHIHANTIDRYVIKKLVQKVFTSCRCAELHQRHQQAIKECDFEDDGIDYGNIDTEHVADADAASEAVKSDSNNTNKDDCDSDATNQKESRETEAVIKLNPTSTGTSRVCPGHERAIPIEHTVNSLDIKEDSISTLLCYLELHPQRWLENMTPVYSTCTINCYGGPPQMMHIAKKCPPVAVAIAMEKRNGMSHTHCTKLEFPVIVVSDKMGWDSGPVKKELKLLQWNFSSAPGESTAKSGVVVQFSELGFHLRSPGDLTDEEIDGVVDFLNDRILTQESSDLANLHRLFHTLHKVSFKNWYMCGDEVNVDRCESLRLMIREYFDHQPKLECGRVTTATLTEEAGVPPLPKQASCQFEGQVRSDIRQFIHLYGCDHQLSGRVIARILHGIPSPCFPSEIWGRVRRFWRAHLNTDFNLIRQIATEMLLTMK